MSVDNRGVRAPGTLSKLVAAAMVLLAMLACGEATQAPEPTSVPPPGMFSTLRTTENPGSDDRPTHHRSEHTGAHAHAHAQSDLYAGAYPDASADA